MKFYVINLDRKKERWVRMKNLASELHLCMNRISAVDSFFVEKKEYHCPLFNRNLSRGEVACFLSHKKVWEIIAEDSSPFGVVFEDDVVFSEELINFFKGLDGSSLDFDIIHLEDPQKKDFILTVGSPIDLGGVQIYRILSPATSAAAMVISKKGAKKLLDLAKISLPVDELLLNIYSPIWKKLKIYQLQKILVWQLNALDVPCLEKYSSSLREPSKTKRQKSLKVSAKKLFIKIGYLFSLLGKHTYKVPIDKTHKKSLESAEKRRMEALESLETLRD